MPTWLIPFLIALVNEGATTLPKVIALGKSNGMSQAEIDAITAGYDAAIAQAKIDAGKT